MTWLAFQWYQEKETMELFIADVLQLVVLASGRKLLEESYELLTQF